MSVNRNDRRSVFIDYAIAEFYPGPPVDTNRTRSLNREASIARTHKLDNVDCAYYHHRMKSIEKDLNETSHQLDGVNRHYHDMHANFLGHQIESDHKIHVIEDHVVDQSVQLNRILTLLEQEEFELKKRLNLYRSKSRRRIRPIQGYRPYRGFEYNNDFEPKDLADRLSRVQHFSEIRQSHAPNVEMSQLDAQLESIKNKNRRYKPSFTEKCYEGEEDGNRVSSYMKNPPRAFRLGEPGYGESESYDYEELDDAHAGESPSERRARERKEREAHNAEQRRIREEKMDAEHKAREDERNKARQEREEREEKERFEREEKELKDIFASKNIDVTPLKDHKVIFVIGGPGSGKGTQCAKMVDRYGYTHISSGDLLRKEVESGSRRGRKLNDIMKKGGLVPDNVVLDMIKEEMLKNLDSKGFLIDGYPRKIEQGVEFEKEIVPAAKVLLINASDESMKDRLLNRGKSSGRSDDNEEAVNKRLEVYHEMSEPVIDHYEKQGKLERIDSEGSPDNAFAEIKKILDEEECVFDFDDGKVIDVKPLKDSKVYFIVGGPGSGKGTQCQKMVDRYGYTHISSGDLLRDEVKSGSDRGKKLGKIMAKGKLVPNKVVLDLIKQKMLDETKKGSNGFLIDGYPRKVEQGDEFDKEIVPCTLCFNIEASDKTMKDRLLARGKDSGRADDNETTIAERLKTFHKETKPVINHYEKQGKLKTISAEKESDIVFEGIKKILDKQEGFDFETTKKIDVTPLKDAQVIFVVGGPGSGKGTQCEKINNKYGYTHISTGDLLRAEVASGSDRGKKLDKLMKRGLLVPNNVMLEMIKEKMLDEQKKGSKGFMIDGYPRQVDQGKEFEKDIVECALVLNINASDKAMKERLKNRKGTSRGDDSDEAIDQRIKVFHEQSPAVLAYYEKAGKLRQVNSEETPEKAFAECKKHIDKYNRDTKILNWKDHISQLDDTVDEIVHCVMNNASKGKDIKQNVASTIQDAIKELISGEMEPLESGFDFLEYDHLEIYKGPSKLMRMGQGQNDQEANLHGEIIIRVGKGHHVDVKADEVNDTLISHLEGGELIIRNVDTNLVLNVANTGSRNHHIDFSIVGQAYIRDLWGDIKAEQFQGIVIIKNDLE